jgi:hypothetical protein
MRPESVSIWVYPWLENLRSSASSAYRGIDMTPLTINEPDPDAELAAWQEVQAEAATKQAANAIFHRCPSDMPPCPVCEELYDDESFYM